MQSKATTPAAYLASLAPERKAPVAKLHRIIKKNLPKGFADTMAYGMIGYVVPHTRYPAGYHCDPTQPLPFMGLASQKDYVSVYHMGLSDRALLDWFRAEWKKRSGARLDMGKGCVRLRKVDAIPYDLIGELATKVTLSEWIAYYEKNVKR